MRKNKTSVALLVLSIAGLLFSGYLSGVKLFTSTCAFNEACPYFLGYPACYFGFVMFLLLTLFSFKLVADKAEHLEGLLGIKILSVLGILFAGYFTFLEIPVLLKDGLGAYIFGLPTCTLGFLFYLAIAILAFFVVKPNKSEYNQTITN